MTTSSHTVRRASPTLPPAQPKASCPQAASHGRPPMAASAAFAVYNMAGSLVKAVTAASVDISDLDRGIYVITDGTNTVKAIR